ncbi:ABC-type transport system permease protein (probable substrate phosphate) [Halobacterium hubeiense]|jgi:phosphate transport system permease protein|uniref:Phosphate transport system permease protein PstA n=1 Tax=Halobacterium hubeiense TaxID=1407499 RepID=A0A0U5GY64_9EURY|nr:phosphate ABC transporter permease PstA [Halobacterium hubeiense]CQH49580.1 ABC-type transport system permease protein (probable substrate phosphate) [Halobacterium hubeiense]
MATNNELEGFGRVSRTAGTLFRYLLLAATLFGLVFVTILLVYVANDAIQPLTADPGWHLTFLLTLVLPTLAAGAYAYRRGVEALRTGVFTIGFVVVALMFSGGAAMIFVDIVEPLTWLAFLLALAVPTAVTMAVVSYDHRISFVAQFVVTVAAFYLSLFGVPGPLGSLAGASTVVPGLFGFVSGLPFAPAPWLMMAVTLGPPVAYVGSRYVAADRDRRAHVLVGATVFAVVLAGGALAPFLGVDPVPGVVVAAVGLVPPLVYAVGTAANRPTERVGLLVPSTVVVGSLVGAAAADAAGFAGPQSWVDWAFLTGAHSSTAADAGFYPAIGGSILLMLTVAVLAFPVGIGAAVYLEEYAPDNRFTRVIDVNISNLAGVPSVVYGLLGLGLFVTYLNQPPGTVLLGGATLGLLILPIVIISAREAIRAVPEETRAASYGMGATKWQTVKNVVLPRSFSGILTGTILALGRAIGETAPLIMIGAPNVKYSLPAGLSEAASAMPLQVYAWSSLYAGDDFYQKAVPAGVVVLVAILLAMNSIAIVLRNKYQSTE